MAVPGSRPEADRALIQPFAGLLIGPVPSHREFTLRKTGLALVVALAAALGSFAPGAHVPATRAASDAKVVIIVGAVHGQTSSYRQRGDAAYAEAIKHSTNVVKVYSPNATWAAVKAAVQGARVVIYMGHGNGWPSPYTYDPLFTTKDGFGLNATAGNGDYNNKYYGEPSIRTLEFAPNALILLHHLCYAAGNSEPGDPEPSLSVAKQRADNYASAFLAAGASAVIADGHSGPEYYLASLFTTNQTLDQMWQSAPNANGNTFTWASVRSPGKTVSQDPESPTSEYYRAASGTMSITTTQVLGAPVPPPPPAADSTFTPVTPVRLLDTRTGNGLSGKFTSRSPRTFFVAGRGGIPADATAVTGNLTVTEQTSSGFLSLSPIPDASPSTSTLNFPASDNRANNVTVRLSNSGGLSGVFVGSSGARAHVLFDVTGYFRAGTDAARFTALDPTRLLDTRFDLGLAGAFASGTPRTFNVAGLGGVPAGAIAVAGNLTVTGQTRPGFVSLGPVPDASPTTSSLNFPMGDTRANGVVVPLGDGGTLSAVYVSAVPGTVQLIFDVTGYFATGGSGAVFVPVNPARLLDSRSGNGLSGAFSMGDPRAFDVAGRGGVPADAIAVTGNLTVVRQTRHGHLSLGPSVGADPSFSTLNFPTSDVRANGVAVDLGGGGSLSNVYVAGGSASTDVLFDVTGYFH
jgi:hypothetical protein